MNESEDFRERVSALADGQLEGDEFALAVARVCGHDDLRASWRTYHLVGEVLRSGGHAPCSDQAAFLTRLQQRLAAEPQAPAARLMEAPAAAQSVRHRTEAANEPVFRWKLVAGAASLAAAAAIGWNWVGGPGASPVGAQLAQSAPPSVAVPVLASAGAPAPAATTTARIVIGSNGAPQVMLRDPRLDALLEAHQQAAGVSQMPSGFLRNATFEGSSR